MTVNTMKLIIGLMENVAGKELNRPITYCVQVDAQYIAATDGHVCMRVEHNDSFLAEHGLDVVIPSENLPYLKAALKLAGRDHIIKDCVISKTDIVLAGKSLVSEVNFPRAMVNGFFNAKPEAVCTIALDAEKLYRLAKSIKGKTMCVKLEIIDHTSPIRVTCTGQQDFEHKALLMPMRL